MSIRQYAEVLGDILRIHAVERSRKDAFVFGDQAITYGEFNEATNRVANSLIRSGILSQSRIALLAKDSHRVFEVVFGAAKVNAVTVPINWRLTETEILNIINDSEAEILFVGKEFLPIIEKLMLDLKKLRKIIVFEQGEYDFVNYDYWLETAEKTEPLVKNSPEFVVVQMYTSGTTGNAKGVQLTNSSFLALLRGMESKGDRWIGLDENDVNLLNIPTFHIGGLWWGIQSLTAGAKTVIIEAFNAPQVLDCIQRYRVTKLALVPAMIRILLSEPECNIADLSSLKHILYGGSPISLSLLRQAMRVFKCAFTQVYGMTETGNMAVCLRCEDHDPDGNERMKSVGKPLPGVDVRVVGEHGDELLPYEVGELWIRSPATMIGYWHRDEQTKNTLHKDGWVLSGDAGYKDADGYIYVCDRIKDMIICAGENIYPTEIENVICGHESVAEAAVVGIPDQKWGELINAIVVIKPGASLSAEEVIRYCRGRIPDFKVPHSVEFASMLPRNPSGKILKRELRAKFWLGQERMVN